MRLGNGLGELFDDTLKEPFLGLELRVSNTDMTLTDSLGGPKQTPVDVSATCRLWSTA